MISVFPPSKPIEPHDFAEQVGDLEHTLSERTLSQHICQISLDSSINKKYALPRPP